MTDVCCVIPLSQGLPRGGQFRHHADLVLVCTSIIFTCSVQHAAVNAPQYNEYAFPPNYPIYLAGQPPMDRVSSRAREMNGEDHIFDCMLSVYLADLYICYCSLH